MACVYIHTKPNKEIFYVGISKNIYRPYSKHNRNKYWNNIVNKYNYNVDILFDNISYTEAIEVEKYLILYYGRKCLNTGNLVNITNGGEGVVGMIRSKESRLKMSLSHKNLKWSEKRRNSQILFSKINIVSQETRLKMSKNNAKTKSKKTIDLSTGIIYNSCLDACNALNLKYKATKAQLNGQNKNKSTLKYI